jgi:hypothetical protein
MRQLHEVTAGSHAAMLKNFRNDSFIQKRHQLPDHRGTYPELACKKEFNRATMTLRA